jgi:hypothetical protein
MATTEIGALIVSLRSESAQFRAEMDRARTTMVRTGQAAVITGDQFRRFGAIAVQTIVPGLQASTETLSSLLRVATQAGGSMKLLGGALGAVGAALGAFSLGNIIANFADLRREGHGFFESMKLAVGNTKSYEEGIKAAAEEQKKFSKAQADNRAVVNSLDKELATLNDDYRTLARLAEQERRARIQTLPVAERQAAELKSQLITTQQIRQEEEKRAQAELERQAKLKEQRAEEGVKGTEAAAALGLSESGLIRGRADIKTFTEDVAKLAVEIRNMAQEGVPARDIFTEIQAGQEKIDATIARLKVKFADVPTIFNQLVDIERQIGGGGFRQHLDDIVTGVQNLSIGSGAAQVQVEGMSQAFDRVPVAIGAASQSVVIITGQMLDLANAVAQARIQLMALAGAQAVTANAGPATAPGNF